MAWYEGRLAAFDIETTGTDPESDRIVTAAVSLVGGGRSPEHLAWLLDPGIEIPAEASAVHGITTERARTEGRHAGEATEEITSVLADQMRQGVPIIAYNARFDLTILDRESRRHAFPTLLDRVGGPDGMIVIDPYVIDKQFDRFRRGKRTLEAVCEHYRVRLDEAHTANTDAIAAARVAYRLGSTIPELCEVEPRALHCEQVAWAAEQAASLEDYFREKGRPEAVERVWPIAPERLAQAA